MADANTIDIFKNSLSKDVPCFNCGATSGQGNQVWYNPTVFNGDSELEFAYCKKEECLKLGNARRQKLQKEIGPSDKERKAHAKRGSEAFIAEKIEELEQAGFKVQRLNGIYQIRINGELDIFPVNKRYHELKKNKRGDYRSMIGFVSSYFQDQTVEGWRFHHQGENNV